MLAARLFPALLALAAPADHLPPLQTAAEADHYLQLLDAAVQKRSRQCDALEAMLAEYEDWGRLPKASDPAAALTRRAEIDSRFWALYGEAWGVSGEERQYVDAINLAAVSHSLGGAAAGQAFVPAAARAAGFQSTHLALDERLHKVEDDFKRDRRERDPILGAARLRQEHARKLRRAAPFILGAAGLLAALPVLLRRLRN